MSKAQKQKTFRSRLKDTWNVVKNPFVKATVLISTLALLAGCTMPDTIKIVNDSGPKPTQTIDTGPNKSGCQYNNPPCEEDYECVDNSCVLQETNGTSMKEIKQKVDARIAYYNQKTCPKECEDAGGECVTHVDPSNPEKPSLLCYPKLEEDPTDLDISAGSFFTENNLSGIYMYPQSTKTNNSYKILIVFIDSEHNINKMKSSSTLPDYLKKDLQDKSVEEAVQAYLKNEITGKFLDEQIKTMNDEWGPFQTGVNYSSPSVKLRYQVELVVTKNKYFKTSPNLEWLTYYKSVLFQRGWDNNSLKDEYMYSVYPLHPGFTQDDNTMKFINEGKLFPLYDVVVIVDDDPNVPVSAGQYFGNYGLGSELADSMPGTSLRPWSYEPFFNGCHTHLARIRPDLLTGGLFYRETISRSTGPDYLPEYTRLNKKIDSTTYGLLYNPRTNKQVSPAITSYLRGWMDIDKDGITDNNDPFISATENNIDADFVPDHLDPDLTVKHVPYQYKDESLCNQETSQGVDKFKVIPIIE